MLPLVFKLQQQVLKQRWIGRVGWWFLKLGQELGKDCASTVWQVMQSNRGRPGLKPSKPRMPSLMALDLSGKRVLYDYPQKMIVHHSALWCIPVIYVIVTPNLILDTWSLVHVYLIWSSFFSPSFPPYFDSRSTRFPQAPGPPGHTRHRIRGELCQSGQISKCNSARIRWTTLFSRSTRWVFCWSNPEIHMKWLKCHKSVINPLILAYLSATCIQLFWKYPSLG